MGPFHLSLPPCSKHQLRRYQEPVPGLATTSPSFCQIFAHSTQGSYAHLMKLKPTMEVERNPCSRWHSVMRYEDDNKTLCLPRQLGHWLLMVMQMFERDLPVNHQARSHMLLLAILFTTDVLKAFLYSCHKLPETSFFTHNSQGCGAGVGGFGVESEPGSESDL